MPTLTAQPNAIDTNIPVFRQPIDLGDLPAKIPPAPFAAFLGEFQRFLLDTLRAAGRPMDTLELGEAVMATRALDSSDKIVARLIARRTGYALCKLVGRAW